MKKIAIILFFSGFFIGYAYLKSTNERLSAHEYPRFATHALPSADTMKTSLGLSLKNAIFTNPQKSGFRILSSGGESLEARMALVQAAERTLDLQYYAINDDVTSNLLMEAIIRAAERGVRVRFLIDDINQDSIKKTLSALNSIENLEVRIFNPITTHDQSFISRIIGTIFDLPRINKRMHNKVLIADNLMSITGGRNLGDEYFDHSDGTSFKDIDILTSGPITSELSNSFDQFWNDENSLNVELVYFYKPDQKYLNKFRKEISTLWDQQAQDGNSLVATQNDYVYHISDQLIWAYAEVTADDPEKVRTPADESKSPPAERMARMAAGAEEEFIIVSSYLVPQDEGVKWITGVTNRNVKVKILTNSLASTDVVAAHTGYRRYRKDFLTEGAEVYEMKPTQRRTRQRLIGTGTPSHASLHSKFFIVDRKTTFVGSFNLDPRSVQLNTEVALVIHSSEIAKQMYDLFERITTPTYSYKIELDDEGAVIWKAEKDGKAVKYTSEPDSSFWRKIQAQIISILPIENHL
jgi:putative cardiolipin synthase